MYGKTYGCETQQRQEDFRPNGEENSCSQFKPERQARRYSIMMIYAIEFLFEDGSHHFVFYQSEDERNYHFKRYCGPDLVRRRDFKEVEKDEDVSVQR